MDALRTLVLLGLLAATAPTQERLDGDWPRATTRGWIGPAFWANRLTDWSLLDGEIVCAPDAEPGRTLHVLTRRVLADAPGTALHASVRIRVELPDRAPRTDPDAFVGLRIGAGAPELDPRALALVQSGLGPDGGLIAGVDGAGHLFVRRHGCDDVRDERSQLPLADLRLHVDATPAAPGGALDLAVVASDPAGTARARVEVPGIPRRELAGGIALTCQRGAARTAPPLRARFDDLRLGGGALGRDETNTFGPIAGTLYTLSRGRLRLTAQLLPLGEEPPRATLEELGPAGWAPLASADVIVPGFTAHFDLAGQDASRERRLRVAVWLPDRHGTPRRHVWPTTIRAEPAARDPLVLAAFTGNHNVRGGFGAAGFDWNRDGLWFPHDDLVARVRAHDPDLLFFSGDQVYEGASPTRALRSPVATAELDYLYKWLLFVWAFRDLASDRPTVAIPDDHDVYQGNLWGAGGRPAQRDHDGGYVMPPQFVRMVERTQTAHLPPPVDPTPVDRGIGTWFTSLRYGGVDFAILEDRKFKSGPNGLVPPTTSGRPDHVVDPTFDPARADVPGAVLLGDRQLAFLERWATDWSGGTRLKVALSQSPFAGLATHHGAGLQYIVIDYDSNGWPQSGRNRAVAALRSAFALHVAGDQHLATLVWHGIDDWRDAGWSFAVPSIANFYPRAWQPPAVGANREAGTPDWTGDHRDGLGNHVTVYAATNPGTPTGFAPAALHDRMPGFGIVRLDPAARTYTVECWPRAPTAAPYAGWPRTLTQREQYGRAPAAWLPELDVAGCAEPVVEVRTLDGELVWALRAPAPRFRPWTFAPGRFAVRVSDPDGGAARTLLLDTVAADDPAGVRIALRP
ncbi:MAG: alkaline phosphatase D family protein [Planctomycetes bacterium]|nr:alkaline phosphatase D family protein [Planctomycetota bacterium]